MSAFMTSDEHRIALAVLAYRLWIAEDINQTYKILSEENARSMRHRYYHIPDIEEVVQYSEPDSEEFISAMSSVLAMTLVRTFNPDAWKKLIDCYEYQSSEASDWDETEAAILSSKIRAAVTALASGHPHYNPNNAKAAYDEAAWEI